MSVAADAVRAGSGSGQTALRALVGPGPTGRPLLRLAALDGLGTLLLALFLVDVAPVRAVVAAGLWALWLRITLTSRVGDLHGAVTGLARAAVLAGAACWVGGALVRLPIPEQRLVVLLASAAFFSLLVRVALGRSAAPLAVLVVGDADDQRVLGERLGELTAGRLRPIGGCEPAETAEKLGVLRPDAVLVVPGPALAGREVQRLTWELQRRGVPLLVGTRLQDVAPARTAALRLGQLALLHVEAPHHHGLRRVLKGLWERSAALLALVVLSPALLLVALAVRLDSPGPALFRQVRVGRHGEPFTMIKFRTMCVDAEQRRVDLSARPGHVLFKLERDPRITRVGRVLRQYSLDELPQLLNVVRGEMALVGPRPALPSELEQYDEDPLRRLAVTPGLTGLWQVSGRSDLSWEESVRLDLDYVDNWSLGLDLVILLRTVGAVLRHTGAY